MNYYEQENDILNDLERIAGETKQLSSKIGERMITGTKHLANSHSHVC